MNRISPSQNKLFFSKWFLYSIKFSYATPQISYATTPLRYATTRLICVTTQLSYATTQLSYATTQFTSATPQLSYATTQLSFAPPQIIYATPQLSYATPKLSSATPIYTFFGRASEHLLGIYYWLCTIEGKNTPPPHTHHHWTSMTRFKKAIWKTLPLISLVLLIPSVVEMGGGGDGDIFPTYL